MQLWARGSRSRKDGSTPTRSLLGCPPYPKNQVKHTCNVRLMWSIVCGENTFVKWGKNKRTFHGHRASYLKEKVFIVCHCALFNFFYIVFKDYRKKATEVLSFTSTTWNVGHFYWLYWYFPPSAPFSSHKHKTNHCFSTMILIHSMSPGQRDRAPDHMVQPVIHAGACYCYGTVSGDQHS